MIAKPVTLLVVLAHPDDESFSMGGSLAKYAAQGVRVALICATRGEAGIAGVSPSEAAKTREKELRAAAKMLGVKEIRFLGYPDGGLAAINPEPVVQELVQRMLQLRPDAVITFGPDGISAHPDHVAIHHLTTEAFDRAGLRGARLFYLHPSPATQQGCGVPPRQEAASSPVVSIDVREHLVEKIRAMQCHASQEQPFPGSPEEEAIKLARHEYFTLARPRNWLHDLDDLFAAAPTTTN